MTATVATTSTTVAGPTPEDQAVETAYLAYWDALIAAVREGDPEHPQLVAMADGALYDEVASAIRANNADNNYRDGTVGHTIQSVTVDGDTAIVVDCIVLEEWEIYDRATGVKIPIVMTSEIAMHQYTLVAVDTGWAVTSSTETGVC